MVQEATKATMVSETPSQQVNGSQVSIPLASNQTHRPITNVSIFNNGTNNVDASSSLIRNSLQSQGNVKNTSNGNFNGNGGLKDPQILNTNCGILKNPEIELMLSNLNLFENNRERDFYGQKNFNACKSSNKIDLTNVAISNGHNNPNNHEDLAETMLGIPRSKCSSCSKHNNHLFFLSCLHSYCPNCLQIQQQTVQEQSKEQHYESGQQNRITCVVCDWNQMLPEDIESLPEDAVNKNVEQFISNQNESPFLKVDCTLCKGDSIRGQAVVYCSSCPPRQASICAACMRAHLSMNRFKDHILHPLPFQQIKHHFSSCSQHPDKKVSILCRTCKRASCMVCCQQSCLNHDVVDFEKDKSKVVSLMTDFKENCIKALCQVERIKKRESETEQIIKKMESNEKEIKEQIVKDFEMAMFLLNVKKVELLSETSSFFQPKQVFLENISREFSLLAHEALINLQQIDRLKMFSSEFQECFFENYFDYKFKINDIKFENKFRVESFRLDYMKRCPADPFKILSQVFGDLIQQDENKQEEIETNVKRHRKFSNVSQQDRKPDSKRSTPETTSSTSSYKGSTKINNKNNYDKTWRKRTSHASRSSEGAQSREVDDIFSKADMFQMDDTSYKSIQCLNTKGGVSRKKIYCKLSFGEEGYLDHQFLEPGGICSNQDNEVIVADANNHQVKVFDLEGRLLKVIGGFDRKREAEKRKFLMESEGLSEDQANKVLIDERDPEDTPLVFPNRVSVCPISGNIVVTERTPTNRVQVISKQNIYLHEFGQKLISHPRGVAVDWKGNILVLESKVNRVLVFSGTGKLQKKFYLSQADFPNSVAVNKFQEVYVADNKRHCVHVYDYNGEYLRQIGGLGTTNYPISVCIGPSQEVYVMDNHTNFNVTLFNRSGELLGAVQSDFKHNQCYDACVTHNNHVIVSTRDNKIHIYSLPVYFLKLVSSCSDDEDDNKSIHNKQEEVSSNEILQPNYDQKQRNLQQPQPNGNFSQLSPNFQYWPNLPPTPQQFYNNLEIQSFLNNNWNIPFFNPHQATEEVPSLSNFCAIKPNNNYQSIDNFLNFVSSNSINNMTNKDTLDNVLGKLPNSPGPHGSLQHYNFEQQPPNNYFNFYN